MLDGFEEKEQKNLGDERNNFTYHFTHINNEFKKKMKDKEKGL